ncbi:hypothetical protein JCM14467A_24410 [Vulcanisaeta sp. JCM 14467]
MIKIKKQLLTPNLALCDYTCLKLFKFLAMELCLMDFIKVKAGVFNPLMPDKVVEVESIVDTGAVYTVIRRDILEGLGIKPSGRRRFKAFGGYVERDVGDVGLMLMGERGIVPVIFGETDDALVIGMTALEILGLEVDPVNGTLKKTELLLL